MAAGFTLGARWPVTGGNDVRSTHQLPWKPAEGHAPYRPFDELLGTIISWAWGKFVGRSVLWIGCRWSRHWSSRGCTGGQSSRVVWAYKPSTLSSEGCPGDSACVNEAVRLKLALREHFLLHLLFTKGSAFSHCHHSPALARWGRGYSGYAMTGAANTKGCTLAVASKIPDLPTPLAPGPLLSA